MNNIKEIIRSRTAKQKKFCTASAFYFAEQVHRMEVEDLFRTTKTNECLEIIRDLAEVLVWADKNEEDTFDQIVEGKIMETFERIVTNGLIPQEIKINVLSSITLILQNLSRVSSIYLLCSNNHINRMIAIEFDEQDDELLSRYISFLKSLSMRLNKDSVQLFFDREYDAFPLFSKTVKLLASDDALVRTAARQIVLNVAQIDDDAVKRYLDTTFMEICEIVLTSAVELITQLGATVPFLRQKGAVVEQDSSIEHILVRVETKLEDAMDDLLYLNDLCDIPHQEIALKCAEKVEHTLLAPMASAILSEVRGTTDTVGPFSSVPVESVFTVLARWVKLSPRRGPLMEKASSVFLTDPSFAVTIRRGEDWREKLADSSLSVPLGCLDVVLSSPRTDLYLGALLLYTELLKLEKNANRTAEAADDRDTSERKTLPSSLRSLARLETPFQKSGQPLGHVCERLATHTLDAFLSRCYGVSRDGEISFTGESVRLVALLIALYYQIVHTDLCRVSAFYACLSLLEPLLVCLSGARMESMYVTVMQVMQTQILWSLDAYAMGILATQETANATQEYPIVAKNLGQQTKLLFTETLFEYSCRLLCCDPYETVFLNLKFFSHEARTILTDEVLRKRLASGATSSTAVPFFPLHHNTMESLVACAHRPSGTTALPEPDLFVDDVEKLERSSTNEGTGLSLTDVAASREECTGGRFTKADKAEVKEEAYITLCLALARQITLFDRAPVCPSELESNRYFMWFLLRGFFEHLFSPLPDKTPFDADKRTTRLEQYLQPAGGSHEPGSDYVYCQMEAPIILRCEFVSMEENRRPNASYLPGTVMFVTTSDDELIFLEPPVVDQKEMTQELETGLCKRRIVFTLDLDYIQAKCSKSQNFKIYIKSVTPHKMVDLTLVFRDHISALSAVECINMTAKRNRRRGASFSYGLLNYKSALLQYD